MIGIGMRRVQAVAWCMLMFMLASCGKGQTAANQQDVPMVENMMQEARWLRMYDEGEYVKAEVLNPWDTLAMLGKYVLVERGASPDSLPEGYLKIDVPLQRTLVYSSVHAGIVGEIGAANAVAGVADGAYFVNEPFAGRISRGEIVDIGSSMSPSLESVVALSPDAILLSPFENAGHGVIDDAGIPVIECADYMEQTPKGRAEWMRFLGRLYGKAAVADSIYAEVEAAYDSVVVAVADVQYRPVVLTEQLTDGYWFVPGGGSYMACMLKDAGANYPWANDSSAGSLQLDFSSVYAKAADADYWLIKVFGRELTLNDLMSTYLLNSQFKAFKDGNVYVANTAEVPLFDEFPFHPEILLQEYVRIFHGDKFQGELRYFKRTK